MTTTKTLSCNANKWQTLSSNHQLIYIIFELASLQKELQPMLDKLIKIVRENWYIYVPISYCKIHTDEGDINILLMNCIFMILKGDCIDI